MLRNMRLVLAGLLLLLCVGCGGGENDGEEFALYHLETAIGPPGAGGELRCGPPRVNCPGILQESPKRVSHYPVFAKPALTGDHIERSSVRRGADSNTGAAVVLIDLTTEGREAFARVTKRAARVGGRDQAWHHVAVVVGDEIVAFPEIDFDEYPDGIPNPPGVQIAIRIPAANDADARDLVRRLRGD